MSHKVPLKVAVIGDDEPISTCSRKTGKTSRITRAGTCSKFNPIGIVASAQDALTSRIGNEGLDINGVSCHFIHLDYSRDGCLRSGE